MQKILIILGIVILVIGLLYPYIKKLGLGQLPGDIMFKSGNSTFFFPIVTCIVISVVLTIIFNLFKDIVTKERPNIEIVNMVESTVKYIEDKKYKNIGLLSTAGTRKTRVYQELIEERGMNIIMVPENQQCEVDDIIYSDEYGIKSLSYAKNSVKNKTEQIIDGLIKKGADTVILGCTELPIAITDEYYNGTEMINPVDILAKGMLKKESIFKSKI